MAAAAAAAPSVQYHTTAVLVVGYSLCSSLLSVINKYAITKFDYPALLTAVQYFTSTVSVLLLGRLKLLQHDPFTFENGKKYLPAAAVFYLAIFTNTNLLRHANVDTFIVFRSLTPLLVAVADAVFRQQPLPSRLTFFSLVVILAGAVGYVASDSDFSVAAYSWAVAYLITITGEMVYIKHMVTNMNLNTWGFVLYNNLLSLIMSPISWFITAEYKVFFSAMADWSLEEEESWIEVDAVAAVALSCVFALLISFFGFAARKAISATAFTVTGVANKFLTVAINVLIWDKHSSSVGLFCLLSTLVGGVIYQQSVSGSSSSPAPEHAKLPAEAFKLIGDEDVDDDSEGYSEDGKIHDIEMPSLRESKTLASR